MVCSLTAAVLFAIQLAPLAVADVPPAKIAGLIAQLGDPDFRTRDAATKELDGIGRSALPALRTAVATATDIEAARRAEELVERIAKRAENEDILAPTLVTLDMTDATPAAVFAALEKQCNYRFTLPTSPAMDKQRITVRTDGKVPLWTVIEKVCNGASLELLPVAVNVAATNPNTQMEEIRMRAEANRAEREAEVAQRIVDEFTKRQAVCQDVLKQLEARKPAADADEKKKLDELIEKQKAEVMVLAAQTAAFQARLKAIELDRQRALRLAGTTPPVPEGTIALRERSATVRPASVSGSVRVEANPFPTAALATVPNNRLPILLTVLPEPKLKWERVRDIRITKSTDSAGRALVAAIFSDGNAGNVRVQQLAGGQVVVFNGGVNLVPSSGAPTTSLQPTANQGVTQLRFRETSDKITTLATLEGVVRGTVRTPVEEVVALTELTLGKPVSKEGNNGTKLQATLSRNEADPTRYSLTLILNYDPSQVVPEGSSVRSTASRTGFVRAGNVVFSETTSSGTLANSGLVVSDANGQTVEAVITRSTTRRSSSANGQLVSREVTLTVTATEKTVPTKLAFRAAWSKLVEVPFTLKNVPVVAGTGPADE